MYAMIGVCMGHKFIYEIADDYQSLNIFFDIKRKPGICSISCYFAFYFT